MIKLLPCVAVKLLHLLKQVVRVYIVGQSYFRKTEDS